MVVSVTPVRKASLSGAFILMGSSMKLRCWAGDNLTGVCTIAPISAARSCCSLGSKLSR